VPRSTAIVLKGYPRLSETFIAQEIYELERCGLPVTIVSLRQPTDARIHPVHRKIKAPVLYLPEYLYRQPLRLFRAWFRVRRRPGYRRALSIWLGDLKRDRSANRVRRFGQALVLANEMPTGVEHLHAHFLHTPSSVTRYASILSGLDWSASAHAVDIYTTPDWEIVEKIADCQWLVTCTDANRRHLVDLIGAEDRSATKIGLVYHGTHTAGFERARQAPSQRDGLNPSDPVRILSVGRAVAKKGFPDLLHALASLPVELNWRFTHVGGGEMLGELKSLAARLDLEDRITWLGALAQEQVIEQYAEADIFALACRIAEDGDRDGLPNVLMEAQSTGLACVSTCISGIPELIENGITGLLVDENNPAGLSRALNRLIIDPARRGELGARAAEYVAERFEFASCFEGLAHKFGLRDIVKVETVA